MFHKNICKNWLNLGFAGIILLMGGIVRATDPTDNLFFRRGFEGDDIHIDREKDGHIYWIRYGTHQALLGMVDNEASGAEFDVALDENANFIEGKVGLRVDARKLIPDTKLVLRLLIKGSDNSSPQNYVPGENYTMEIWAKADMDDAQGRLFFEGEVDGNHWWKATDVIVNKKWQKYKFTQPMPANMDKLVLRFDFKSRAVFWVDGNSFYKEPSTNK